MSMQMVSSGKRLFQDALQWRCSKLEEVDLKHSNETISARRFCITLWRIVDEYRGEVV